MQLQQQTENLKIKLLDNVTLTLSLTGFGRSKVDGDSPVEHSSCPLSLCAGFLLLPWFLAPCGFLCGSFRAARPEAAEHWSLRNQSSGPDQVAPEPTAHLGRSKSGGEEYGECKWMPKNHMQRLWSEMFVCVSVKAESELQGNRFIMRRCKEFSGQKRKWWRLR